MEKEKIALIAKDIINMLAEKNCTIEEAEDVLRIAKSGINSTSTVRKLEY